MTEFLETLAEFEAALIAVGIEIAEPNAKDLRTLEIPAPDSDRSTAWDHPDVAAWLAWGGPSWPEGEPSVPVFGAYWKLNRQASIDREPLFADWYESAGETLGHMWKLFEGNRELDGVWVPLAWDDSRTLLWNSATGAVYGQERWQYDAFIRASPSLNELLRVWLSLIADGIVLDGASRSWKPSGSVHWTSEIWGRAALSMHRFEVNPEDESRPPDTRFPN